MKVARRSVCLALLALFSVLAAGPVAAASCRKGGCCLLMAQAAKGAPCGGASGGMSAPMDCCRPIAAPAPAAVASGLEPPAVTILAALPVAGGHAVGAVSPGASRSGRLHSLGLFTLNSVWRL